jgi:hypothetical protein
MSDSETIQRRMRPFNVDFTFESDQRLMRSPTHDHEFPYPEGKGHMHILRNQRDPPSQGPPRQVNDSVSAKPYLSCSSGQPRRRNSQERRLPDPVSPDQANDFPRTNLKVDVREEDPIPHPSGHGFKYQVARIDSPLIPWVHRVHPVNHVIGPRA